MKHLTTKQLVIRITLVVAVIELLVMSVLYALPMEEGSYLLVVLDAMFLLVLSAPAIYFLFIKPAIGARDQDLRDKAYMLSEYQRIANMGGWLLEPTGRLSWSDEMYRIFGVSRDTFVPSLESFISLIHPDDRVAVQNWLADCKAKKECAKLEFRILLPDGSVGFISGCGEPRYDAWDQLIQVTGAAQDITARKRAEDQLDRFFELSQDMLCIAGTDGYFKRINPAFTRVLGWSIGEILARPYFDFLHPDDHAAARGAIEKQLTTGEKVEQFEARFLHK
ncbi:MAG: PAS domain-containing protein, partial [Candidatus Nitrotoga sp.]